MSSELKRSFLFFSGNDAENKIENGAKYIEYLMTSRNKFCKVILLNGLFVEHTLSTLLTQSFTPAKLESCLSKMNANDF